MRIVTWPLAPTTEQNALPGVGSVGVAVGALSASSALAPGDGTVASAGEPTTDSRGAETTTDEGDGDAGADPDGGTVVTEGWAGLPEPDVAPLAPAAGEEAAGADVEPVGWVVGAGGVELELPEPEPELPEPELELPELELPEAPEPDEELPVDPDDTGGLIVTFPTPPEAEPLDPDPDLQFAPRTPSRQVMLPAELDPPDEAVEDEWCPKLAEASPAIARPTAATPASAAPPITPLPKPSGGRGDSAAFPSTTAWLTRPAWTFCACAMSSTSNPLGPAPGVAIVLQSALSLAAPAHRAVSAPSRRAQT